MSCAASPLLLSPDSAPLPAGLRARVWIAARHFFSREGTQNRCWLWLHRHDGRVQVVHTHVECLERDDVLAALVAELDSEQPPVSRHEPLSFGSGFQAWRLPDAPVVPVPRWQVSWGHPVQRAIRAFAATLDMEVMQTLGDLEVPGPFFGSAANYNRLATLPQPRRTHRLQALAAFPPLVAPLLLEVPDRPDLFGDDSEAEHTPKRLRDEPLLVAIERGRDLIGALAAHYRVDRALVRSPLCRTPWASSGAIPADALRLFAALPAHARPCHVAEAEPRLQHLKSLPFAAMHSHEIGVLANAFRQGWDNTWSRLESIGQPLQSSLRNTRDFLAAAVEQAGLPESLADMPRESLGLAWAARRGLASLLLASIRWHMQPQEELPAPGLSTPCTVLEPALEEVELEGGRIEELLSEAALAEEGARMHHCVADYWNDCLTTGTRIVHLQLPDGERATAEFKLQGSAHDPRFFLQQLSGPCNAEVSTTMDHLAHSVLGLLNATEQRERRVRVADSAYAAMCAARKQPAPRRTIRKLDPRSRRELARVIAWCEQQEAWRQRRGELFCGYVAGFRYAAGVRVFDQLHPFDALALVREPANPHDRYAVRVDWRGHKLGYIPRDQNRTIAHLLDTGTPLDARIVVVNNSNEPWSQLEIRVERIESDAVRN